MIKFLLFQKYSKWIAPQKVINIRLFTQSVSFYLNFRFVDDNVILIEYVIEYDKSECQNTLSLKNTEMKLEQKEKNKTLFKFRYIKHMMQHRMTQLLFIVKRLLIIQ